MDKYENPDTEEFTSTQDETFRARYVPKPKKFCPEQRRVGRGVVPCETQLPKNSDRCPNEAQHYTEN